MELNISVIIVITIFLRLLLLLFYAYLSIYSIPTYQMYTYYNILMVPVDQRIKVVDTIRTYIH